MTKHFTDLTSASILADSISPAGYRITTLRVTFPRFVLPEFNTHRAFSRSFRSSRAVPTKVLLEEVRSNPVIPCEFGLNRPGMQASDNMVGCELEQAKFFWVKAAREAADRAEELAALHVHKQVTNRLIEPFLWVHGVVTATEWNNFFRLRCHNDAQPEFRALAIAMRTAIEESTPEQKYYGEWHVPFIREEDKRDMLNFEDILNISAARCARVSYKPFGSNSYSTISDDLDLVQKLMGSDPKHFSPFEHQARVPEEGYDYLMFANLEGWASRRTVIEYPKIAGE